MIDIKNIPPFLTYLAIGDAYGAEFEFSDPQYVKKYNTAEKYYPYPQGKYTDDTQMSLALAEMMMDGKSFTPLQIAESFVRSFHRDPRRGYSGRFYRFLLVCQSGKYFLDNINSHGKDTCGAAMRSVPLGLLQFDGYKNPKGSEMYVVCKEQASLTHNSMEGISSSFAVALMVHHFIYREDPKQTIKRFLTYHVTEFDWENDHIGKVENKAVDLVKAVLSVLLNSNSITDILKNSVAFTGDVDSVAAVACGIASFRPDIYENNMPKKLIDNLENNKYGLDYLDKLSRKLTEKYLGENSNA